MPKNIIFCFTGTGNSLKAARDICAALPDCAVLPMTKPYKPPGDVERIGFVYPVYFRGVPLAVKQFITTLDLSAAPNAYLYTVATCGGSPGSGLKECNTLLAPDGRSLDYGAILNMGGNYILMYGKPRKADATNAQADRDLYGVAAAIRDKTKRHCGRANPLSVLFADIFRRGVYKAAKHYAVNDDCVSCGLCARVCPVGNITINGGKPAFGERCEQCMACIQWCPQMALNYKDKTQSRERYHHPAIAVDDVIKLNGGHYNG